MPETVDPVAQLTGLLSGITLRLEQIVIAVAVLLIGIVVAYFVKVTLRRSLAPRLPPHVYKPLETIIFYSLLFLAGVTALYPFGINLSALLVAGGFAGLVIGLAAQNTLSNLVSGVMLLIEQPLRVGDPVSVAGVSGVVVNISVFSTKIRTWEGPVVRIPNNEVFNSVITNFVRMRARRVEFTIGVHYDTNIQEAVKVLKDFMEEHPLCLVNPAPEAFVESYGDSSINIRVRCWAPPQAWFATKVDLQTRVKDALDRAGIKIPYPQLDLHVVSVNDEVPIRISRPEPGSNE